MALKGQDSTEREALVMATDVLFANLSEYNYNPMNDVLFKFIFGKEERKQITIDFLNAVLEPSLGHSIKDLTFASTEMNPEHDNDKLTRLDVSCILDTQEQVDVEVQVLNEKNMNRRTLFYWAQMYLMSLPAGKTYNDLKPAITVNLLNFAFLPQEEPHAMYGIYNKANGHQLTKDLELHFLEIPKYANQAKQKSISQMTKMERWLAYFANQLDKKGKEELAMSEAAIQEAMEAARIFFNNTAERRQYINREMARMDRESMLQNALNEGVEKGKEKGRAEGKAEGIVLFGKLANILLAEGKSQDLQTAISDPDFRDVLFKKYHLQ